MRHVNSDTTYFINAAQADKWLDKHLSDGRRIWLDVIEHQVILGVPEVCFGNPHNYRELSRRELAELA